MRLEGCKERTRYRLFQNLNLRCLHPVACVRSR
jgi:hypothetical protein